MNQRAGEKIDPFIKLQQTSYDASSFFPQKITFNNYSIDKNLTSVPSQ